MQRFEIYHKSDRYYLTNNKIVYYITIPGIIVFLVGKLFNEKEDSLFETLTAYLLVSAFFFGAIAKGIGFFIKPPLRGTLEGFLSFQLDEIIIDQKHIPISQMKKITISNNDYYGKRLYKGRGNFNSNISNGVDNKLEIILDVDKVEICYFQLYYPNDFQKLRNELIHYYQCEKLDFNNLTSILGIEVKEIEAFRNQLESSTANTHQTQSSGSL